MRILLPSARIEAIKKTKQTAKLPVFFGASQPYLSAAPAIAPPASTVQKNDASIPVYLICGQRPPIKNYKEYVFRLIAKIAHAYAMAEYGLDKFKPLLIDCILREPSDIQFLIGGTETSEIPANDPYQISHEIKQLNGASHIVVSIRLFAKRMGPTFLAVTGVI